MKLGEKIARGRRYAPALEAVLNLIDNSKSAYEKTLLNMCLRLLLKAKHAVMQNK